MFAKMKPIQTLVLIVLTAFCQAECPIECYCDRITTCTGDKLLTRFPTKTHATDYTQISMSLPMLRLELHEYSIKHLSRQDFLDLISNLTEISISRNSLETFDNETFALDFPTSSATSTVTAQGSSGTSVSSSNQKSNVGGYDSRRTFFALSPRNSGVSSDSSASFLKLRILDLSQNKLKYFVGGGKLRKLKILDLSSNMLQQVYDLSAIESLESVNLRNNRISFLEANIFQNLRNLQYVNLDSNALGIVDPSTFSNLPTLAHLILSSNPISNLLPGFYWNSRVQFVDVSNVGLTSIPPSLTKTVRDFRCANNNLTIIRQTDFESYPNVGLLVLDENAIEIVEDDAFGRLDFLSRLWINGNRLKRIPQNLPPSLRSLQLEDNRIVNISSGDFKNLKKLEELNLHSNRISSLPPSVFAELTSLKSLDLRSNQIDVIYRDSFANLSKLETLDISQNPIKVIVTGAFESLRRVTLLHLSRLMEPIELDVSSFRPLQNLQILELDDSPHLALRLFQDGGFSYFPNIFELNVQRCELEDVNLVSNALVELNPQSVKMNENLWDCEDLHGSAIHELLSRMVVVDQPTCAHPPKFQGIRISALNFTTLPKASLNVMPGGGSSDSEEEEKTPNLSQPFVTPLTRSGDNSLKTEHDSTSLSSPPANFSKHDVSRREHATPSNSPNARNTNSLEKGMHVVGTPAPLPHGKAGQALSELANTSTTSIVMRKPTLNLLPSVKVTSGSGSSGRLKSSNSSSFVSGQVASGHVHDDVEDDNVSDRLNEEKGPASPDAKSGQSIKLEGSAFVDILGGDGDGGGDVLPTQSYFDYPTTHHHSRGDGDGSSDVRDSSVSGSLNTSSSSKGNKGTNSISLNHGEKTPPANSIPIYNNATSSFSGKQGTRPGAVRSSEETKTNDDNTIIDENRSSSSRVGESSASFSRTQREEIQPEGTGGDASSTAQRSIDGFPPAYPDNDRVAKEAPSGSEKDAGLSSNNPKYSYLKLQQHDNMKTVRRSRNDLPYDEDSSASTHMSVIVKTLVISALTCLGSILCLFFISLLVYRISQRRSRVVFPCARRRCSNEEGEDTQEHQGAGMMYTRFGRRKSKRDSCHRNSISTSSHYRHHHQGESDSDQVELSGITNTLYFENEDIYHIT